RSSGPATFASMHAGFHSGHAPTSAKRAHASAGDAGTTTVTETLTDAPSSPAAGLRVDECLHRRAAHGELVGGGLARDEAGLHGVAAGVHDARHDVLGPAHREGEHLDGRADG